MSVRIAMWSGPRNISTAMMRSFSARSDCHVTDEPFYGAYLKTTGEPHAMAAEIMSDMDVDWQSVAATMRGTNSRWKDALVPETYVAPYGRADQR